MPWPYQMPESMTHKTYFIEYLGSKRSLVMKFDQFM